MEERFKRIESSIQEMHEKIELLEYKINDMGKQNAEELFTKMRDDREFRILKENYNDVIELLRLLIKLDIRPILEKRKLLECDRDIQITSEIEKNVK